MNIDTGEIKELSEIPENEKNRWVPLTNEQAKNYSKLSPGERLGQYKADMDRKRSKAKKKRRLHNKLSKKAKIARHKSK